ncbi:MAG UNVERIFIED_CONTAM: phospholipase D family protein [Rickettsiaceae bacterium]
MKKISKSTKFKTSFMGIALGLSIGFGYEEFYGIGTWHSADIPTQSMNVCFTPPSGCASLVAREIQNTKESIHMHAYGLTSYAIINQLIAASKRGVKVRALLDSSNFSESKKLVDDLEEAGIDVKLDKVPGIAHNKVIIIDKKKVITGSFNFTEAADKRNAENLLLINDKKIAEIYMQNWLKRAI